MWIVGGASWVESGQTEQGASGPVCCVGSLAGDSAAGALPAVRSMRSCVVSCAAAWGCTVASTPDRCGCPPSSSRSMSSTGCDTEGAPAEDGTGHELESNRLPLDAPQVLLRDPQELACWQRTLGHRKPLQILVSGRCALERAKTVGQPLRHLPERSRRFLERATIDLGRHLLLCPLQMIPES